MMENAEASNVLVFQNISSEGDHFLFNGPPQVGGTGTPGGIPFQHDDSGIGTPVSSQWAIVHWYGQSYFNPAAWIANDAAYADPTLGVPQYTWTADSGNSRFSIYNSPQYGQVYSTYVGNEDYTCTFFQTTSKFPTTSLANSLEFSLYAKIGYSSVSQTPADNTAFEIGFDLNFNPAGSPNYNPKLPTESGFLQYIVSDSNGNIIEGGSLSNGQFLTEPFQKEGVTLPCITNTGTLQYLGYDVSGGAYDAATLLARELGVSNNPSLDASVLSLNDWYLSGIYIGVECQSAGVQADFADPQLTVNSSSAWQPSSYDILTGADKYSTSNSGTNFVTSQVGAIDVTSNGADTINSGLSSAAYIHLAAPAATVNGSIGEDHIDGSGNLVFNGGSGAASISSAGSDIIYQAGGSVTLSQSNNVTFSGGSGDSTITAGPNASEKLVATEVTGNMTVNGGAGVETISDGSGNLVDYGGSGMQTVFGGAGITSVYEGSGAYLLSGSSGILNITGGSGADTVFGGSGSLSYAGGAGKSLIICGNGVGDTATITNGHGGNSTIFGGGGSDTITFGAGSTVDIAQSSNQTINFGGDGHATVFAGSGDLTIGGPTGYSDIVIVGSTGGINLQLVYATASIWLGDSAGVYTLGKTGDSFIAAGGANQTLVGGAYGDTVNASGYGSDSLTVSGNGGVIFANGSSGSTLSCSGTGEKAFVSNGIDTVFAGAGDTVWGGAGASIDGTAVEGSSTWAFTMNQSSNSSLSGFSTASDHIVLFGGSASDVSQSGGNTFVQLGNGAQLEVIGVTGLVQSGAILFD